MVSSCNVFCKKFHIVWLLSFSLSFLNAGQGKGVPTPPLIAYEGDTLRKKNVFYIYPPKSWAASVAVSIGMASFFLQNPVVMLTKDGIWYKNKMRLWSEMSDIVIDEETIYLGRGADTKVKMVEFLPITEGIVSTAEIQQKTLKICETEVAMKFDDFIQMVSEYWNKAHKENENIETSEAERD